MSIRRPCLVLAGLVSAALLLCISILLHSSQAHARRPPDKSRPDLTVDRVWAGPGCKVKVQLRNKGRGGISPKVSRFYALKVMGGNRTLGRYTFKEVDPGGRLLKPGGVVVFTTNLLVSSKLRYTAVADPDHKIKEASEGRRSNRQSEVLVPCRERPRRLLMRINRVRVSQGTVRLELTKSKNFQLTDQALHSIRLQVKGRGGTGSWTLAQVDRSGSLRKLGKVEFNTGLKLKKGSTMRAKLKWGRLSSIRVFRVPADSSPTLASGGMQARRPSRRDIIAPGPAALMARIKREQGMRKVKPYAMGIKVLAPREGQEIIMGRSVRVEYRFTSEQAAGRVRFFLIQVNNEGNVAEASTIYQPGTSKGKRRPDRSGILRGANQVFSWQLPSNVNLSQNQEYVVMVMKDGAMGASGSFKFTPITDRAAPAAAGQDCYGCLFITSPKAGDVWPRGSIQRISWTTSPRDGRVPQGWKIYLLKHRASDPVTPNRVRYDSAKHEYYFDWQVPGDYPTGRNFKVQVTGDTNPWNSSRQLRATTGNFIVPENSLTFLDGFAQSGRTYYHSNLIPINWRIDGRRDTRVAIFLRRGDRLVGTLVPEAKAGDGSASWRVGQGDVLQPPGDDYYLRIQTLEGRRMYADSARFTIATPSISVLLPYSGLTYHHGETLLVRWRAPHLRGNVNIMLQKTGDNRLTSLGTALAANGTFMWTIGRLHPDARGEVLIAGDNLKVVVLSEETGAKGESEGEFTIFVNPPPSGLTGGR